MNDKKIWGLRKDQLVYFCIIALTAFALGLSDRVFSNYFKDVYNVTAFQRGLIEFPRELPGILIILVISALAFMGDVRLSIISQVLSFIGLIPLALFHLHFNTMLIFLFINSLGMHLFFSLQEGIGISLIDGHHAGKRMGQYKSTSIAFGMLSSLLVFLGFKYGFFSFQTRIKTVFLVSVFVLFIIILLFIYMNKLVKIPFHENRRFELLFRKEYKYYYILAIMNGVQKQIMIVFGPWVLIELLGKKADTLAILWLIGSFIGIFFTAAIGKWIDKFGIKKMLYADALTFIGVYVAYGLVSGAIASGAYAGVGLVAILAYIVFILDSMSMQFSMVRLVFLRHIAIEPTDITKTITLGISVDHIVSIACAYLGGVIWYVWGPQYIFYLTAALSLVNLYVAYRVKITPREVSSIQ